MDCLEVIPSCPYEVNFPVNTIHLERTSLTKFTNFVMEKDDKEASVDFGILPNQKFVVVDGFNRCVKIFHNKGKLKSYIGRKGPHKIINPCSVAVLSDGTIAVCDTGGDKVQIYTTKGKHVKTYKGPEIKKPYALGKNKADRLAFISDGSIVTLQHRKDSENKYTCLPLGGIKPSLHSRLLLVPNAFIISDPVVSKIVCLLENGQMKWHIDFQNMPEIESPVPPTVSGLCMYLKDYFLLCDASNKQILQVHIETGNIFKTFSSSKWQQDIIQQGQANSKNLQLPLVSPSTIHVQNDNSVLILERLGQLKVFDLEDKNETKL